ncbi:MAG: ribonuclease J [Bacteriovoracaceae bacterium]|nr:ribonuclease J [Bacteriovoracaceae bacterium]
MSLALFSLMPMGGVGEIGSNMTLVRTHTQDIIIDCGLLFPYENFFNINYLIPDFSALDIDKLAGIVITHGHEDHIGALTHFIEKFPEITIYATEFTQDLIKRKTEERNILPKFETYHHQSKISFDSVQIEPVRVTHSIPDTFGLFISDKKKEWGTFFVSDFKFDLEAKHETPFDIQKLKSLMSHCQKNSFFIDSTNALVKGKTPSENDLIPDLENIIAKPTNRLFITLFASNIHRLAIICKIAKRNGRKIVLMGRSVEHYLRVGLNHSLFDGIEEGDLWNPTQVKNESGRMLIIVSGCQGDFLSAFRRLSYGEDATFKLTKDDCIVMSSKVIPGNEKQISRILNKISESDAEIITAYDAHIHASGHPAQEDLKALLNAAMPDVYFPIHGESFFLKRHAQWLGLEFPKLETGIIYNWTEIQFLEKGKWKKQTHTPLEPILIHGKGLKIERTQISQRRKMACQGTVLISLDPAKRKVKVTTLGLPLEAKDLLEKLQDLILNKFQNDLKSRQEDYVCDQLKIMTRQFYQHELGYKPVTEVHLFN